MAAHINVTPPYHSVERDEAFDAAFICGGSLPQIDVMSPQTPGRL
jgi:hypothetical protein